MYLFTINRKLGQLSADQDMEITDFQKAILECYYARLMKEVNKIESVQCLHQLISYCYHAKVN